MAVLSRLLKLPILFLTDHMFCPFSAFATKISGKKPREIGSLNFSPSWSNRPYPWLRHMLQIRHRISFARNFLKQLHPLRVVYLWVFFFLNLHFQTEGWWWCQHKHVACANFCKHMMFDHPGLITLVIPSSCLSDSSSLYYSGILQISTYSKIFCETP